MYRMNPNKERRFIDRTLLIRDRNIKSALYDVQFQLKRLYKTTKGAEFEENVVQPLIRSAYQELKDVARRFKHTGVFSADALISLLERLEMTVNGCPGDMLRKGISAAKNSLVEIQKEPMPEIISSRNIPERKGI